MDIDFSKGILSNVTDSKMPPGFYKDAENIREGSGTKQADEGMLKTQVPSSVTIYGNCSIADDIVILGTKNNKSVIGTLDVSGRWTELIYREDDVLQINGPLQVQGRKNWAGERIIYFSTSRGARRINLDKTLPQNAEDFDKITSLFLEYDLPKTNYIGEGTSGSLLSGVYQFAVRLVTDSEAATPFGLITGTIPVTPGSTGTLREEVVGAPPQTPTNKSIDLDISNVDSAFKYIQIGVLTYVGLANTPVVSVTNLITINDRVNINYTYTGEKDHLEQITLNEFITSGIQYNTGEFFTQSGGSLLMGAPTEADMPDIDWHRVAENIVSKYVVKKIPYKEALTFEVEEEPTGPVGRQKVIETSATLMDDTYKNPITVEKYKGYRREEVYAFTLTPVFTSGVLGPTVHIPANSTTPEEATAKPNKDEGGTLGTFVSQETYPDDRYPSISAGSGLRFHKFPSATQQPIVSGSVDTNDLFIRVLGVKFENIVLHSSELQYSNAIKGYIIGRVNRKGNESQLAQGIARPTVNVRYNDINDFTQSTAIGDGQTDWLLDVAEGGTATGCYPTNKFYNNFTFIAPDLIHNLYNEDDASHIYQHSAYRCNPYAAPTSSNKEPTRTGTGKANVAFKNVTGEKDSNFSINTTKVPLGGNRRRVGPFGIPLQPGAKGGKENTTITKGSDIIRMASSDGFSWMSTLNGEDIKHDRTDEVLYKVYSKVADGQYQHGLVFAGDSSPSFTDVPELSSDRPGFVLYSLYREVLKPYGTLDQMVSMHTHFEPWGSGETEFFNGDTFINKYGLSINDEGFFPYGTVDDEGGEALNKVGFQKPCNMSLVVYMWIESSNNYAFRHYTEAEAFSADTVVSSGSVPFFPAYKILANYEVPFGILSMSGDAFKRPGYASQYNNQYSAQPNIKPFVVTPKEDEERKAKLNNRILYSTESVQGEKADAYQIFLPNNYYDVPSHHGDLTDIYIHNKELFASTKEVQWRLFFNTLATQATSAGEVVLGTGGAFNRPAIPLTTLKGGYGGTSHWTHAVETPKGRVFVDQVQGLIFLSSAEGMAKISNFLSDSYKGKIQAQQIDAIRLGSEPLRDRAFIRIGSEMLSFSLESKVFISRHFYLPRWMFTHGPHLYSTKEEGTIGQVGVYKHSVGSVGNYYGEKHVSSLTLAVSDNKKESKTFNSLDVQTIITDNGLPLPFKTFDQLEVWNQEQYSGKVAIINKNSAFMKEGVMETLSSKIKNAHRMNIPRDVVINPNLSIFDSSNHKMTPSSLQKVPWLSRMKSNYIVIKLTTFNANDPLILERISVNATLNIR